MNGPGAGPPPYDAVVLAGGRAHRLAGADKPALQVGGRALLDRVLSAVADAGRLVVVGPRRPTPLAVRWAREAPPGGGPVAALAAGLPLVTAPTVAVLAADLPFLSAELVLALRRSATGADGALLVDPDGCDQVLAGVWRVAALRAALPPEPVGSPLRAVVGRLAARRVPADARACLDCDTEADLHRARSWT